MRINVPPAARGPLSFTSFHVLKRYSSLGGMCCAVGGKISEPNNASPYLVLYLRTSYLKLYVNGCFCPVEWRRLVVVLLL